MRNQADEITVYDVNVEIKVYRDGDSICALLGEDIQSGHAGFGPTVSDALYGLAHDLRRQPLPWGRSI